MIWTQGWLKKRWKFKDWSPWFAWYPVNVGFGQTVWLQTLWRRGEWTPWGWTWYYRVTDPSK